MKLLRKKDRKRSENIEKPEKSWKIIKKIGPEKQALITNMGDNI